MPANAIHWFEIPAVDIDRSVKFYNELLGYSMAHFIMHNCTMAMFPCESGVGGGDLQAGRLSAEQARIARLSRMWTGPQRRPGQGRSRRRQGRHAQNGHRRAWLHRAVSRHRGEPRRPALCGLVPFSREGGIILVGE